MNFPKTTERRDVVEAIQKAAKIHAMNQTAKSNSFPLRPSSALKSSRELYYGLVNYFKPGTIALNPTEGRNTMLLALGHSIERHFVEFIEKAYAIPYRNLKVNFGELRAADGQTFPLNGELDFVIQSTVTGELIIADSKSSADFPFKASVPKEEHIAQINLYLHSSWARKLGINKAWIMYYNKNNSELKVYEFDYNPELAQQVLDKFLTVLNTYVHGLPVPPRTHVFGVDWQASYSSYKDYDNREFLVPVSERAISKIDSIDIDDLDRKEVTKMLAIRPDSGNIFIIGDRKLWLEVGATTLLLREEKIK